MSLRIDKNQMQELLHDFHALTGIKIVIIDDNLKEIENCPAEHCELCKIIRLDAGRDANCDKSNRKSFDECKQSGQLVIYKCHAGLIEATAPLKINGLIIGYIMFGQITDHKDKAELASEICRQFGIPAAEEHQWQAAAQKVKYKTEGQIRAAARILEALTYYVLQKNLVSLGHERITDRISRYIDDNLDQPISSHTLATEFHISRTRLYELTRDDLGMGLAAFLRRKRMERAKDLLMTTHDEISTIAVQVGIADCAYFAKVFKHEYRLTPSEYRAKYGSSKV